MVRVFANGLGDLGKKKKKKKEKKRHLMIPYNSVLSKVRIKGKWSSPGKGVAPSPTPWCISY